MALSSKKPIIGIPADRRLIGPHPFHAVGEKYIHAIVQAAGALPVLIPVLPQPLRKWEESTSEPPMAK